MPPTTDLLIARGAPILPIGAIAQGLGLPPWCLEPYGLTKAKLSLDLFRALEARPLGRLILVTAITPTPAGEGKTTTTIGLADALGALGEKAVVCIREPSLGPCFGAKGGAAGGGRAQVIPMEDLNLHFTGDLHAVASAHNLLAAVLENHLANGNALGLDPARVAWKRVLDMNDRALRQIVVGLGGSANGTPRETGFELTAASEVMAILCLALDLADLKARLGRIVVGFDRDGAPVPASRLKVHGAMAALLRDALKPNLVQTLEHTPALVHGGPFANIAHGCSSLAATMLALRLADFVVTEAGFGADLGAEKFLDIVCRAGCPAPAAAVLVATVRALKLHGGGSLAGGLPNLYRHLENLQAWGLPHLVAINHFNGDTEAEVRTLVEACAVRGVRAIPARHWAEGGRGALELAREAAALARGPAPPLQYTYPMDLPLWEKARAVARQISGAADLSATPAVARAFAELEAAGFGGLPVCIAKTPYSVTADPRLRGRPEGFTLPIRGVRVAAGAGFVVVYAGDVTTMPGLPRVPWAETIDLDEDGNITGLS